MTFGDWVVVPVVVFAAVLDARTGRVPNRLTYPLLLAGIVLGVAGSGPSIASRSAGVVIVGGLFTWLFFAGLLGGGDAKLMAGVALAEGLSRSLDIALYTAAFGGVMAMVVLLREGRLFGFMLGVAGSLIRHPSDRARDVLPIRPLPFAVAIAAGTLFVIGGGPDALGFGRIGPLPEWVALLGR